MHLASEDKGAIITSVMRFEAFHSVGLPLRKCVGLSDIDQY